MSEMIERVAREIAHQRAIRMVEANGGDPLRIKAWNTNARDFQDAAAAIKAMREPTEVMVTAMTEVPCDEATPGGVLFNTGTEAKAIWQSAIDAALAGEG